MEDIENSANDLTVNNDRIRQVNQVQLKKPSKTGKNNNNEIIDENDKENNYLPGKQKVWVKTYGCSHNISDSEYMEGLLTQYGYELVNESENADVWLVNSCTVKDPSQAAFMNVVEKAKSKEKAIVVAGCVSQADRSLTGLEDVSMIGVSQIDRVVEAVEQTLQGNTIKLLAKKDLPKLDLPKVRKNPLIEIIPLSTGCLGSCTYCKTKQARGKLGSYALEAIVERAKQVISEGVSEIWLSSEDTGAYGRDIGTNIAELLRALIAVLPPQGVMLRVGMTNPPYILEHLESIAEILNHPNVYSFLHVPVQAGSNKVLDAMNREYTIEEFKQVADSLINKVPNVTIATDIICGFPNEDENDFNETISLIQSYQFAIVNISQFYPRPGTPAAKMKRIPTQIVKERSRRLTKLFEGFQPYLHYIGETLNVYFDIEVSDNGLHCVGHTKAYVKVLVPYREDLPGSCHKVLIHAAQRFHIEGTLVEEVYPSNYYTMQQEKAKQARLTQTNPGRTQGSNNHVSENPVADLPPQITPVQPTREERVNRKKQLLFLSTIAGILLILSQTKQ
mmetsp:Transcript_964/g.1006  ORF Transcript_964/g.1006 Transcript_964/m.1006 type:complete len:562 (+) Transcript_964:42-1727(+)